jgi:thioredoxin-related protein
MRRLAWYLGGMTQTPPFHSKDQRFSLGMTIASFKAMFASPNEKMQMMMLPRDGCEHCRLLYEVHRDATMSYHHILNQYELAVLRQDSNTIETLDRLRREAVSRRELSRKAVDYHVTTHEGWTEQ